ncbi:hypothetical protein C0J52_00557 [Blattella germanica]|nr:hypothetical protein C0J52_00557 [Blattella germanica]
MCAVHPFLQPEYKYNVWESSFYLASSHMMSSLAVLVMICVILAGYGGPFTVLFSAKLFVPLARLSYSIFLIHLTLLKIWYIGTNGPNYLSDYNVMGVWLSIVLYSTLLSPVLFLTIEQPFIEINRVLTKKVYGPSKNFNLEPKDRNHCETSILPMTDLHAGSYNGLPEQLNGRRQQNENTIFNISEAMNVGL